MAQVGRGHAQRVGSAVGDDAHTFFVRGGGFANVQTGNVIFFAIDLAAGILAVTLVLFIVDDRVLR